MRSAVEFITKTNILFTYYCEELLKSKLIANRTISNLAKISLFLLGCTFILVIVSLFNDILWFYLSLCLLVPGLSLGIFSLKKSRRYILNNFPEYEVLIGDNTSNYEGDFIKAYKCDMVLKKILELDIDISGRSLDELIHYYERNSDSIKVEKWWPIPLAIAIAFPVWNEFISKLFAFSIGSIAFIIISVITTFYISTITNGLLRTFYLSKANKYKNLADTLRLVKITLNTE